MKKKILQITHNDLDGVGCNIVAHFYLDGYDFRDPKSCYFCSISSVDKLASNILTAMEEGRREIPDCILITDISLSEENIQRIEALQKIQKENGKKLVLMGFDHHPTNTLNKIHKWFHVNSGLNEDEYTGDFVLQSATKLIWKYFTRYEYNEKSQFDYLFKILVEMISRYDTWEWRNHPIKFGDPFDEYPVEILADMCKTFSAEKFANIMKTHIEKNYGRYKANRSADFNFSRNILYPEYFKTIYEVFKERDKDYFASLRTKVRYSEKEINGKLFKLGFVIQENTSINGAMEYLYNNFDVDVVLGLYPATKTLSLRTKRDDLDLGKFAKETYGGGGHKKAAGVSKIDDSLFTEMMTYFYSLKTFDEVFVEE